MDVQTSIEAAIQFHQQGNLAEAEPLYEAVLKVDPENIDAIHLLGVAAFQRGDFNAASSWLTKAISLNDRVSAFHLNLGNVHYANGEFVKAKEAFKKATQLDSKNVLAHLNLGNTYQSLKQNKKAIESYERAKKLNPNQFEIYLGLGSAEAELGNFKSAMSYYKRALELSPKSAELHSNIGLAQRNLGDLSSALESFDLALKLSPQLFQIHLCKAETLFLQGRWKEGFEEYDHRLSDPRISRPQYNLTAIRGDLSGKRIMLFAEQGLGDTLQFIRFAPLLKKLGAEIAIFVQEELRPLLKNTPGCERLLSGAEDLQEFDYFIPLMSLPRIFELDEKDFMMRDPYIRVEEKEETAKSNKLSNKLKVGLRWQGDPNFKGDQFRSIALEKFSKAIHSRQDIDFVSLQRGFGAEQMETCSFKNRIKSFPEMEDRGQNFKNTAREIQSLDLVITTDTSIAHLAGAMGKPVWLLLSPTPGWRWKISGEQCWYSSMKVYRSANWGDWDEVMEKIAKDIKSFEGAG